MLALTCSAFLVSSHHTLPHRSKGLAQRTRSRTVVWQREHASSTQPWLPATLRPDCRPRPPIHTRRSCAVPTVTAPPNSAINAAHSNSVPRAGNVVLPRRRFTFGERTRGDLSRAAILRHGAPFIRAITPARTLQRSPGSVSYVFGEVGGLVRRQTGARQEVICILMLLASSEEDSSGLHRTSAVRSSQTDQTTMLALPAYKRAATLAVRVPRFKLNSAYLSPLTHRSFIQPITIRRAAMSSNIVLPDLPHYVQQRITALYGAKTTEAFDDAFDAFVSEHATIRVNGTEMSRADYKALLQGQTATDTSEGIAGIVTVGSIVSVPSKSKDLNAIGVRLTFAPLPRIDWC